MKTKIMKPKFTVLATIAFIATCALPLHSATYSAASQSAPWLKLLASARIASMGEAGSALAGASVAMSLNPSSLSALKGYDLSLTHDTYLLDGALEHASLGYGLGQSSGLGLSVDYLGFGSVERYDVDSAGKMTANGSFNPSALSASLGYGVAFNSLGIGLNLKMVSQTLDGSTAASAFSGDFGLRFQSANRGGFAIAASLLNAFGSLEGSTLPSNGRIGLAYGISVSKTSLLNIALDASLPLADSASMAESAGLEYATSTPAFNYALRGGHKLAGNSGLGGMSFGAGLGYGRIGLDYAYLVRGELGSSSLISLRCRRIREKSCSRELASKACWTCASCRTASRRSVPRTTKSRACCGPKTPPPRD